MADSDRDKSDIPTLLRLGSTLAREAAHSAYPTRPRRELAELLVRLREQLNDYRGLSHEYRRHVTTLYENARLSPEDGTRVRNGVRHHVSQVLRERLTPAQLEEFGLTVESRNELRNARRTRERNTG